MGGPYNPMVYKTNDPNNEYWDILAQAYEAEQDDEKEE